MSQYLAKAMALRFPLALIPFTLLTVVPPAAAQVAAPPGLISEWRCENNFDDPVSGNNGFLVVSRGDNGASSLNSTAAEVMGAHKQAFNTDSMLDPNRWQRKGNTFAPGLIGTACRFDGTTYVQVPTSPSLHLATGTSVTLEAWVRRTSSAPMHVVGKRGVCGSGDGFYQIAIDHNPVGTGPQPEEVPVGTWTHLALSMNGLTGWSVYVNGVLVRTTPYPGFNIQNSSPLRIGGSGTCAPFAGLIDEVYLYNRALTPAEVQATYKAGRAGRYLVAQSGAALTSAAGAADGSPANASSAPVAEVAYKSRMTTKMRDAPNDSAKPILDVPMGSVVRATGDVEGSWWAIEFSGKSGWIPANTLKQTQ